MATHQQAGRRAPRGRYGPAHGLRLRWIRYLLGAVALGGATAIVVILGLRNTAPVQAAVQRFTAVSAREVDIVFAVRKPAAATAQCVVRARGRDGAEVGRAVATIVPRRDGNATSTVTYRLPTTARAVTGEVVSCTISQGG